MATETESRPRHRGAADNTEKYLYQIRNMLAWILVLIGLSIAGGIIAGIVIGAHSAATACQSQGGTDPSC